MNLRRNSSLQLNTIFWGNSDICLPTLTKLDELTSLKAIFTGKDKYIGRNKKKIKIPEPKEYGLERNIPVYQEDDLKKIEVQKIIKEINPDVMIVMSYGKIIPLSIFNLPPYGTLNIHTSKLPQYRGASPIQNSLLNGDLETGVTLQKINEKLDEGNIILLEKCSINSNETYLSLKEKLALLSAEIIEKYFNLLNKHNLPAEKKQEGNATYCHKIKKDDGKINFAKDNALTIYNKWRAFYLWPGIFCDFKNNILKIKEIDFIETEDGEAGSIIQADKTALIIKSAKNAIKINNLQPANRKPISYIDFINGFHIKQGNMLT